MRSEHERVPLMFQAQVEGRSQIQRLIPSQRADQQAYDWAEQWQQACDQQTIPSFESHVQTREYQFTWRMVTNSGQDAGVIRPVIGDRGWAYFPGSSMKGAFLRACRQLHPDQVQNFCGGKDAQGELRPGALRFHGGYPKDAQWLDDSLVDIVHPQEDWQTKNQGNHSALIQISLYQPAFVFGISSSKPFSEADWSTIWQVWQAALEQGIGSRVSAGYGQIATHTGNKLVSFGLSGEGQASKLINGQGEFRSNLFKAALRGQTRRLFNGLTDEQTADRLTKLLWGGIGRGQIATVGMLGISFSAPRLELDEWVGNNRNNRVPVYETGDATLDILSMRANLTQEQLEELRLFMIRLMKFSMLLGGFGKSWRRADHRLFLPDYNNQMIGSHWQFTKRSHKLYIPFQDDLKGIARFLETFYNKGKEFSWLQDLSQGQPTPGIREAWYQDNVQVWGRLADDEGDSLAIRWLHGDYKQGQRIKQSELTGKMGQIGRIWHRMYPRFRVARNSEGREVWKETDQYAELLTIFPKVTGGANQEQTTQDFLQFLQQETDFKQLW